MVKFGIVIQFLLLYIPTCYCYHLASLGLDLGTTTSAISVLNGTTPIVLSNIDSAVSLHSDGFSVGSSADATYTSVKRLIGKGFGWFHQESTVSLPRSLVDTSL